MKPTHPGESGALPDACCDFILFDVALLKRASWGGLTYKIRLTEVLPMADWNWRDEFEEKTDHGATVLVVVKDGDRHIGLAKDNDGCVFSVQGSLICKPKPKKFRPWTRDEVPVGAVVVHKDTGNKHLILGTSIGGCLVFGGCYKFQEAYERLTLLDGSPCGIQE